MFFFAIGILLFQCAIPATSNNGCEKGEVRCQYLDFCLPAEFVCNGNEDCYGGEDESLEIAGCCPKRDLEAAKKVNRPCRKECADDTDCRDGISCLCDHECGMSCVNTANNCTDPPTIPNQKSVSVMRTNENGKLQRIFRPFKFQDYAYYECRPGYVLVPSIPRRCHARKNWTETVHCALACADRNSNLECGAECVTDVDCGSLKCACDGDCGRSCIDPTVDCPPATAPPRATIDYSGSKVGRIAHFTCNEGTYPDSGDNSLRCYGSGKWIGKPVVCKEVTCGNPFKSIHNSGGDMINYEPPFTFNEVVEFKCGHGTRMLGSRFRTCQGNGRWSGRLTVCDQINNRNRCSHPGVPINGRIKNHQGFYVGKTITFECDEGYILVGEAHQECTRLRRWSGNGAPLCVNPKYSDMPADVVRQLSESTANINANAPSKGRSVDVNNKVGNECFILIDISSSVTKVALQSTVNFAKALIRRLSSDSPFGVDFGISVFANRYRLIVDIDNRLTVEELITTLQSNVVDNINALRNAPLFPEDDPDRHMKQGTGMGTNIQQALEDLDKHQLAISFDSAKRKNMQKHVFVLTDGKPNAGGIPRRARLIIEEKYQNRGHLEFYSITSSANQGDEAMEVLNGIASNSKNFIYVSDFYQIFKYVDQVTNAKIDYGVCGHAGDVGSIQQQARAGRTIGGEKAQLRAWPWQVAISEYSESVFTTYTANLVGGGSLINEKWVLTASHVFNEKSNGANFALTFGMHRRPMNKEPLVTSAQVFRGGKVLKHPKYNNLTYEYDIALIEIGENVLVSRNGLYFSINPQPKSLELTPYVRPICLACSPKSCVNKVLRKPDQNGQVLIKGDETPEEMCEIEKRFLHGDGKGGAVVTGFGHNKTKTNDQLIGSDVKFSPTRNLHQVLLQLLNDQGCKDAMTRIRNKVRNPADWVYNENFICAESFNKYAIADACDGDSGGPLSREVYDEETGESCWVQLGVVSYGFGCGQKIHDPPTGKTFIFPGFYSNVALHSDWIMQNTEIKKEEAEVDQPDGGNNEAQANPGVDAGAELGDDRGKAAP